MFKQLLLITRMFFNLKEPQPNEEILDKPLSQLSMSTEFMRMANLNHFETLRDVLQFTIANLLRQDGMSYELLVELTQLLRQHKLWNRLK
jgi:hypothetical protein